MLPRKNRLKKKEDFQYILSRGGSFFSSHIALRHTPNNLDYPRFGFIVSKKEFPLAVNRNDAKRRIKAIIRKYEEGIRGGKDVLFSLRSGVTRIKFNEAEQEVKALLKKSNLLK